MYHKYNGELIAKCWTENAVINKSKQCIIKVYEDNALLKLK
jgi:protein associated with RNAse G/E